MGRKRIELDPRVEAEIQTRTARGESADTIVSALSGAVSRSTIARLQQKLRSGGKPAVVVDRAPAPPKTETEDETLVDAPIDVLKRQLAAVERGRTKAEKDGNLAALASLSQRALAIAEAIRKSTPLPPADPNARPDYLALAKIGEGRFLALIRSVFFDGNRLEST